MNNVVELTHITKDTVVIIYMYDPKLSDMLSSFQEALPEMMSAAGMSGITSSLLEWMQIYLYGFIMLLFPLIFIIILIQKLVMNYIDSGSMANLLSTHNSRVRIIVTQAAAAMLWILILLVSITVVGICSARILFPDELDMNRYLLLNASTLLLQLAVCGIAFLAACIGTEAKHYYIIGAGLPIMFFLFQMISNMGEKLENLKYITLYTLLPSARIVKGDSTYWQYNFALGVLAFVFFGAGVWWFARRDLPL